MILNSHNKSIGSILHHISPYQNYYIAYLSLSIPDFFWDLKSVTPKSHVIHRILTITRIILYYVSDMTIFQYSDMPISQLLHRIFINTHITILNSRWAMYDVRYAKYNARSDYSPILDITILQYCDWSISSNIFSSHVLISQICYCNKYITSQI